MMHVQIVISSNLHSVVEIPGLLNLHVFEIDILIINKFERGTRHM